MCYHAKFGLSASDGVVINRGEPQRLGALEFCPSGTGDMAELKIHAPPHMR